MTKDSSTFQEFISTSGNILKTDALGRDTIGRAQREAILDAFEASGMTGLTAPTYDAAGNTLTINGTTHTYDQKNQLTSLSGLDSSGAWVTVSYRYDPMGRRISSSLNNQMTLYAYDGWNVLEEYNTASPTTPTKIYTWGIDLSGTAQAAGGVSGLLYTEDLSSGTAWHHHYDGNGNVTHLTDASATCVASYTYDAFGNTETATGSAATTNKYRFSTKPIDDTIPTNPLYYYGYRFYNPITGRWINRDPIEEKGGLNLYGFVGNDGICRWDNLGQFGFDFGHSASLGGCVPIVPGVAFCLSGGWEVTNSPCCQNNQRKRLSVTSGKIEASLVFGSFTPLYIDIKDDINLNFDPPPPCPDGTATPPDGCISFGFNAGMLNGECSFCIEGGITCGFSWQMYPQSNWYVTGTIKVRTHSIH